MTSIIYGGRGDQTREIVDFNESLLAAAKIVESVAFDIAKQAPVTYVEELLDLARGIEHAAAKLSWSN